MNKKLTFDSDTAYYKLSYPVIFDPTTLDYGSNQMYYYCYESLVYQQTNEKLVTNSNYLSRNVFSVNKAEKKETTTKWNNVEYASISYNLTTTELKSVELDVDNSDIGLYQSVDDYGTTYYYRGNVKNNNVYFGGFYWQIIRINGDGSLRIIYNGTEKNAIGKQKTINEEVYQFSSLKDSAAYVGYMYGNPAGATITDFYKNTNNSDIKTIVDNWYKDNIFGNDYSDYISGTTGFCGDRSIDKEDDITNGIQFGAWKRYLAKTAQLICPDISQDLYTTGDAGIGNKALIYPIGLITYDEIVFAGIDGDHINKLSWIYSSRYNWTMTPSHYRGANGTDNVWLLNSDGNLNSWSATYSLGIRPVINLKSDVKITGGIGTTNDPFVIDTN